MYRVMRDKLINKGINVIEEDLDMSLGYCEVSNDKPIIHIVKNLDEMNKIGVLFHEAVHASSYWTKRSWWFQYRQSAAKRFCYMEEALALQKQIEISTMLGLQETYSSELAAELYSRNMSRLGEIDKIRIDRQNDLVNVWLFETFKGITNDLDRHLYKAASISSPLRYSNISSRVGIVSSR